TASNHSASETRAITTRASVSDAIGEARHHDDITNRFAGESGSETDRLLCASMRSRLTSLLALALPMVMARASQSVITFADAIQIKEHGARAIAAVATGGLNVIGVVMLPMSTAFIVQNFVSQLNGRGGPEDAPRFAR